MLLPLQPPCSWEPDAPWANYLREDVSFTSIGLMQVLTCLLKKAPDGEHIHVYLDYASSKHELGTKVSPSEASLTYLFRF